jgi:aminoglycoside 6'-N-acetyltransferase I
MAAIHLAGSTFTSGVVHRRRLCNESPLSIEIRLLLPGDAPLLRNAAAGVFDHAVGEWSEEFLADPRHHLAVAIDNGRIVGMASGVHYVHPDKAPELWVNEVGVSPSHRGRGLGRRILAALLAHGRTLGCGEAWLLTDPENTAARRMYAAAGGVEAAHQVMVVFTL